MAIQRAEKKFNRIQEEFLRLIKPSRLASCWLLLETSVLLVKHVSDTPNLKELVLAYNESFGVPTVNAQDQLDLGSDNFFELLVRLSETDNALYLLKRILNNLSQGQGGSAAMDLAGALLQRLQDIDETSPDTSLQVSLQFYIQKINKLFTNETDLKPKHCYEWALTLFETSYLSKSIGNSPKEVAELIYRLLSPNPSETLYDSDCGSGSLLSYLSAFNSEDREETLDCYGQSDNPFSVFEAKARFYFSSMRNSEVHNEPCLLVPPIGISCNLRQFDMVVSNYLVKSTAWPQSAVEEDEFGRFKYGEPPQAKGDFAYIQHMIACMNNESGRVAVVVSLGVLYRQGAEAEIRENIIKENLLDAVIFLPSKLYQDIPVSLALLIFRARKQDESVVVIDASGSYSAAKTLNVFNAAVISSIGKAIEKREEILGFSRILSLVDLEADGYVITNIASEVDLTAESSLTSLAHERRSLLEKKDHFEDSISGLLSQFEEQKRS